MDEFFAVLNSGAALPVYKFFNGQDWSESVSGNTIEVVSPIDGKVLGLISNLTTVEIDEAIKTAVAVQPAWEAKPLNERVKIMHLAADYLRHYEEYLANLLVFEIGKTHDEARSEIKRTADLTDYFANEVQSLHGETLDSDNFPGFDKGRIALIERAACGVVLAIAPFNYPVNLAASKIVPALLMGNTVVFKPASQGAISGLHLTRIFERAGLPSGTMVALTGSGETVGNYLIRRPEFSVIGFTGNSDTGRLIATQAGLTQLLFECGGNNPAVVMPDADLGLTAREIIKGAMSYSGQRCTAIKYVLATQSILDRLLPLLEQQLKEFVKMGDPRSPETKLVGPVISEKAAVIVEQTIKEAVATGATVIIGGKRERTYVEPTILNNVKPEMKIVTTETFGPILSLISVNNLGEAITIINNSHYGLQASVFTRDEGTGIALAKQLNVGTIQINGSPQRGPDHFPFLGIKKSGLGVQGVRYSLEGMSRLKPVILNKPG